MSKHGNLHYYFKIFAFFQSLQQIFSSLNEKRFNQLSLASRTLIPSQKVSLCNAPRIQFKAEVIAVLYTDHPIGAAMGGT